MKKRVLSFVLALTLVLSLLPAAAPHAHAEEDHEHTYEQGKYATDTDYHYPACDVCGYWSGGEYGYHEDKNADCICDVCQYDLHKLVEPQNLDNGTHQGECCICTKIVTQEHRFTETWDEEQHWFVCECGVEDLEKGKTNHSYDDLRWGVDNAKHYPQCDACGYSKPAGEAHDIPAGSETCVNCNICGTIVHPYVWDGVTWDPTQHVVVCTACEAEEWENHADGADEDTLCDGCGFNLACPHEDYETQYDEEKHCEACTDCGQAIYNPTPHIFANGSYHWEADKHYPQCTGCNYYQPEGEPHNIPEGEEECTDCGYTAHQYAWDGETWDATYHMVICTVCGDDIWEEHADGADEDALCDVCGFNLACPHEACEYLYDAVIHYYGCTACRQVVNSSDKAEHSFDNNFYLAEEDKHYTQCDICSYYDPEGEPHNIPEGGEVCTDCGATVHQYVWNGETWDTIDHKIICTACQAERWENHADGEDEDALCDLCGFNLGCPHDETETKYDEYTHSNPCAACGQILTSSSKEAHSFDNGRYHQEEDKHYPQCDFCEYSQPEGEAHADTDGNSYCDICNYEIHEHTYEYDIWYTEGGYHYPECDSCPHYDSEKGAQCVDLLVDHVCDVCHRYTDWLCVDADNDHVCDVCQRELHDLCVDADNDHDCDVQTCQRYMRELCAPSAEGEWICASCGRNFCNHYIINTPVPNGDGTHTATCYYCGTMTEDCTAWHYDYDETTHTVFCECGYKIGAEEHNYSWDVRSLTGHVVYCENCYHQSEPMPHTTQNGTCEICQMQVTPYEDVYVGGVGLKDGQYLDNSGNVTATQPQGGYAYYKDGVLELNGYVYAGHGFLWREFSSGEPEGAALYATKALILVLKGENSLQITRPDMVEGSYNYGDGITSEQDLTVRGEGSLSIQVEDDGIQMDSGDVTIEGGTLTVSSGDHGFDLGDNITVTGGTVQMTAGDDGFNVSGDITISGGSVTIDAEDNGLDSGDGSVEISGGTVEIRTEDVNGIDAWEDVVISGGYITIEAGEMGIHTYGDVVISGGDLEIGGQEYSAIFTEEGSVEISGGNLTLNAGNDDVIGAPQGEIQLPEGAGDPSDGTLTIVTPFAAALEADGIHLTGRPWDLTVLIVAYDESGMLIDLQLVENPGAVVIPTATGATVKAFFLNGKSAPLCADLPVD